jgi:hypothetical protein
MHLILIFFRKLPKKAQLIGYYMNSIHVSKLSPVLLKGILDLVVRPFD